MIDAQAMTAVKAFIEDYEACPLASKNRRDDLAETIVSLLMRMREQVSLGSHGYLVTGNELFRVRITKWNKTAFTRLDAPAQRRVTATKPAVDVQ